MQGQSSINEVYSNITEEASFIFDNRWFILTIHSFDDHVWPGWPIDVMLEDVHSGVGVGPSGKVYTVNGNMMLEGESAEAIQDLVLEEESVF